MPSQAAYSPAGSGLIQAKHLHVTVSRGIGEPQRSFSQACLHMHRTFIPDQTGQLLQSYQQQSVARCSIVLCSMLRTTVVTVCPRQCVPTILRLAWQTVTGKYAPLGGKAAADPIQVASADAGLMILTMLPHVLVL